MRIAIEALSAQTGGGLTYILNLVPNLLKLAPQHHYRLYVSDRCTPLLQLEGNSLEVVPVHLPRPVLLSRFLYQQLVLPLSLRRNKIDLLFSTSDITSLLAPFPVVLANRNLAPFNNVYPKTSKTYWRLWLLHKLVRLSTYKAAKIIFVSEYARQVVSSQFGLAGPKTITVHHGVGFPFRSTNTGIITDKRLEPIVGSKEYILSVSDTYKYKNFVNLIRAFALIYQNLGKRYYLIIVGNPVEHDYYSDMKKTAHQLQIEDRVRFISGVSYETMPLLYSRADLFIFPSFIETFGHPLVEAMASGVPVVASNASAIPEICGDGAIYFDPFDVNDIANKMEGVLKDSGLRASLRDRGLVRAKDFSWEKTAKKTLAVFEEIASGSVHSISQL